MPDGRTHALVLAGTYRQYTQWIAHWRYDPRIFPYLISLDQLQGIAPAKLVIVLVGTYAQAGLYKDVRNYVETFKVETRLGRL